MFRDEENRIIDLLRQMQLADDPQAREIAGILIKETLVYRDWLLASGQPALTVGDTRAALTGLECLVNREPLPDGLTERQRTLVARWYERITIEWADSYDSRDQE
jgi:hypothetical protein